jgi:nucleoside-diphosphate-sugar epimerase
MKVLVTGGGGFLGRAIVIRLLARGDSVVVLGRSSQNELEAMGVRMVCGNISEIAAVREACRGVDAVIHTAAKAGVWGPREEFYSVNVTGTRNVLRACREMGVKYLVHTSTPSVVYTGEDLCGVDESIPYGHEFECYYAETKAIAEQDALSAYDYDRFRVCALRPHLIWGVGDPHLLPRVFAAAKKKKLRIVGDGTNKVDITHVDNAARAHLLALDALIDGRACGRPYFISQGEPVELWPWLNGVLERMGLPIVKKRVSLKLALGMGTVSEAFWHVLPMHEEPRLTRFTVIELARSHWFDISAARRDLGYEPTVTTEQGVSEYVADFLLKKKKHHFRR